MAQAKIHVHAERLAEGFKTGQFRPLNRIVWTQADGSERAVYARSIEILGPSTLQQNQYNPVGTNFPRAIVYVSANVEDVRADGYRLTELSGVDANAEVGPATPTPSGGPIWEVTTLAGQEYGYSSSRTPTRIGFFSSREKAVERAATYAWEQGLHDNLTEGRDEVFVVRCEKGEWDRALSYYNDYVDADDAINVDQVRVEAAG